MAEEAGEAVACFTEGDLLDLLMVQLAPDVVRTDGHQSPPPGSGCTIHWRHTHRDLGR
ncbi:MAG: hypothetical protein OXH69_09640 [Acidobacteria bacterium]|nr:hypothetical protein [Acidobacteriota bacterium]